jgi:hypothetical protein
MFISRKSRWRAQDQGRDSRQGKYRFHENTPFAIAGRQQLAQDGSNPAKHNQNQHDDEHQAEPAAAVISRAVKAATADAAQASQQRNDQQNEKNGSE